MLPWVTRRLPRPAAQAERERQLALGRQSSSMLYDRPGGSGTPNLSMGNGHPSARLNPNSSAPLLHPALSGSSSGPLNSPVLAGTADAAASGGSSGGGSGRDGAAIVRGLAPPPAPAHAGDPRAVPQPFSPASSGKGNVPCEPIPSGHSSRAGTPGGVPPTPASSAAGRAQRAVAGATVGIPGGHADVLSREGAAASAAALAQQALQLHHGNPQQLRSPSGGMANLRTVSASAWSHGSRAGGLSLARTSVRSDASFGSSGLGRPPQLAEYGSFGKGGVYGPADAPRPQGSPSRAPRPAAAGRRPPLLDPHLRSSRSELMTRGGSAQLGGSGGSASGGSSRFAAVASSRSFSSAMGASRDEDALLSPSGSFGRLQPAAASARAMSDEASLNRAAAPGSRLALAAPPTLADAGAPATPAPDVHAEKAAREDGWTSVAKGLVVTTQGSQPSGWAFLRRALWRGDIRRRAPSAWAALALLPAAVAPWEDRIRCQRQGGRAGGRAGP